MFRSLWFGKLLGSNTRSNRRRQASQQRRNGRLQLEGLEDRITPATFDNVATAADLAADITYANNHTSEVVYINLAPNTTFDMTGQGTQVIAPHANVNIIGSTGDTIIPQSGTRAFQEGTYATASFQNLTITGGKIASTGTVGGAAIYASGATLNLTNVSIVNNTVFAEGGATEVAGGAIFANYGSEVTITDSHIDDNQILTNVTIGGAANTAKANAEGGGIAMIISGTLTITDSTISNNLIQANGNGTAQGGGLYLQIVPPSGVSASLTNVTLDHNTAIGGSAGGSAFGGGIADAANSLTMLNSAVTNNTAQGGNNLAGAGGNAFGGGLGIHASGSPPFGSIHATITNCTFVNNKALGGSGTGAAGGIANGGGIQNLGGLQLINSTLGQNLALGGAGTTAGAGTGGGLMTEPARLINDTIAFNQASDGTIGFGGTAGGIWTNPLGATTATNTLVQANNASAFPDVFTGLGGTNNIIGGPLQIVTSLANKAVNGVTQQYFPLLPNAAAIGAGTTNVVPLPTTDQIGNPRTSNNGTSIDIGAVQFFVASTANVNFLTSPQSIPAGTTTLPSVTVTVTDQNGTTLTSGNLILSLVEGDGTTPVPGVGTLDAPVSATGTTTLPNGTTGPLTLPSNLAPGTYFIKVEYSNSATGMTGSNLLSLTVTAVTQAPTVTLNPLNQTVLAGSNGVFTATANGSPTPTVQWQVSTNGGLTFTDIPGQTTNTLALTNVSTSQNGNLYRAVFTNSAGTVQTTAALLTVPISPVVTLNPVSQSVAAVSNVIFTATATGIPTPTVQWEYSFDGGLSYVPIAGATSNTLVLNAVSTLQNGFLYRAVFTNSAGSVDSAAALLTVTAPSPSPSPSPNTPSQQGPSQFQALFTIAVDAAEFILVSNGITSVNGFPLPPALLLLRQIQDVFPFAGPLGFAALQVGANAGNEAVASLNSNW